MPIFRRRPLHERLLERGAFDARVHDDRPVVGGTREPGVHGLARQREWDAVATVRASGVDGDEVAFVALPDGTLLAADTARDTKALAPFAQAVERQLERPYRARAVRRDEDLWAVGARSFRAVALPDAAGNTIELSMHGDERHLTVDGVLEFGTIRELEALAAGRRDYVVRAERLAGAWWEVKVDPL